MASRIDISLAFLSRNFEEAKHDDIIKTFIWYGILGIVDDTGRAAYIYEVEYNSHVLEQSRLNRDADSEKFEINKAFWPALKIDNTGEETDQMHLL